MLSFLVLVLVGFAIGKVYEALRDLGEDNAIEQTTKQSKEDK